MVKEISVKHKKNKRKTIFCCFLFGIVIWGLVLPNIYYIKYLLSNEKITAPEVTQGSDSFSVISYNIRCKTFLDNGKKSWFYRADLVMQNLKKAAPDLIGLQEVTKGQFNYLEEHLENYSGIIKYRENMPWSEGCPIFFNTNRYELLETKTFWLSETPDVVSKSWQSANYRICTYVILYDKIQNKQIAVFNTHLDHKSEEARQKGMHLICREIESIDEMPVILMGDFNAEESSETYRYALHYLADAKYEALKSMASNTYNGWGEYTEGTAIDYIMIAQEVIAVDRYLVETEKINGEYPSDHFPIFTQLKYAD